MSHTYGEPPTGQQGWPPPPSQPPPRRRGLLRRLGRLGLFAAAGFGALLVLVTVIAVIATSGGGPVKQPGSTVGPLSPSATDQPTAEQTSVANDPPRPGDFELTVKVLKKTCFGEAGCNITYQIVVAYDGPAIGADTSYSVTYSVRGGESGPQINTFKVTGDSSEVDSEEFISTSSAGVKLTARVTDVAPG